MYEITYGSEADRRSVESTFPALAGVAPEVRENIVTAWVSVWRSSSYASLGDVPQSLPMPQCRLVDHVNDVARVGAEMAAVAGSHWGYQYDPDVLAAIFLLHDIDKPLIYSRNAEGAALSDLGRQMAHGVVGAMLLRELNFPLAVVATVSTHAADAPFHGESFEAYVLHYADMFSVDHLTRKYGMKGYYQPGRLSR